MIRIAAFGDCHVGEDSVGTLRPALAGVGDDADVLLLAGDLTRLGTCREAEVFASELADVPVPIAAVLGNHDYHSDCAKEVADVLREAGVAVLEGSSVVLTTASGARVGVAGVKGFGTGFPGAMCSDFGEPEMKAFVRHSHSAASALATALSAADVQSCDARVALTHYAPVNDTLQGERLEIHPFLGSYHLAEAIDAAGADLALHGHAHGGTEKGMTPGGVHVRNVAQPVIRSAYRVYCIDRSGVEACE